MDNQRLKKYVTPDVKIAFVSPHTTFLVESEGGEAMGTIDDSENVNVPSGNRKRGWNEGFDYGW